MKRIFLAIGTFIFCGSLFAVSPEPATLQVALPDGNVVTPDASGATVSLDPLVAKYADIYNVTSDISSNPAPATTMSFDPDTALFSLNGTVLPNYVGFAGQDKRRFNTTTAQWTDGAAFINRQRDYVLTNVAQMV